MIVKLLSIEDHISTHQVEQVPKKGEIVINSKGRFRVDSEPEYHFGEINDYVVLRVIKLS